MALYSPAHSLADFVGRVVSKRGAFKSLFFHHVIQAIQKLERSQHANAWLTISYYNADGAWASYKGCKLFILVPAQHHLRLIINGEWPGPGGRELIRQIKDARSADKMRFKDVLRQGSWRQWRLDNLDLAVFCEIVNSLETPHEDVGAEEASHPRFFPSEVRQRAYSDFVSGGSVCPGVPMIQAAHKLSDADAIEYDHIIPHSKRGASTAANLQILCMACNRLKAARVV